LEEDRRVRADFVRRLESEVEGHGAFLGNRKATILGGLLGDLAYVGRPMSTIPTMVTPRELRFLANYFASHGIEGSVVEIGPYLGGSTQAIACGLADSGFAGKFHVADTFSWPDPGFKKRLLDDFRTLGGESRFGTEVADAVREGDWYALFGKIHGNARYGALVNPYRWSLPHGRDAPPSVPFLKPEEAVGAYFVDAFKRWDTTFHGMKLIAPHLREGSLIIFQDFSWVDCFWLPILVSMLGQKLKLTAKVDNTAFFEVVAPFGDGELDAFGLAPDPNRFGIYSEILRNWALAQFHSGDDVGFLCHSAQRYVLCHAMGRGPEAADQFVFVRDLCQRLNATWLSDMLSHSTFDIPAA
jgi:hypothetical protein